MTLEMSTRNFTSGNVTLSQPYTVAPQANVFVGVFSSEQGALYYCTVYIPVDPRIFPPVRPKLISSDPTYFRMWWPIDECMGGGWNGLQWTQVYILLPAPLLPLWFVNVNIRQKTQLNIIVHKWSVEGKILIYWNADWEFHCWQRCQERERTFVFDCRQISCGPLSLMMWVLTSVADGRWLGEEELRGSMLGTVSHQTVLGNSRDPLNAVAVLRP